MNRLMAWPLMDAAGDGGGGGGAADGGGQAGGDGGAAGAGEQKPPAGGSAAAAIAGNGGAAGAGEQKPPAGGSAAAAIAAGGAGEQKPPAGGSAAGDVDLAAIDDEAYAKLVQPDVDGETVDRSLITPMAKELREAGIQPGVMAKIGAIYRKVVRAEVEKDEAARVERMKTLTEKCLAETTDEEKKDFAAAYAEHIAKDPELKRIVDTTELGSSVAFVRLVALAGATLRVERTPPATAAAGSSQKDTDRAVYEATVPRHLR